MSLQKIFKQQTMHSLKNSDFLKRLTSEHMSELKKFRLGADHIRTRSILGAKKENWKPYLLDIINKATAWPPRERVLSMELYPYLSTPVVEALDQINDWTSLSNVPLSYFKPEFVAKCISRNADSFTYLPITVKRESTYHEALRHDGLLLKSIPYDKITIPMCEIAVEQNGLALEHVPIVFKNQRLCLQAIEQNPMSLKYVPANRISFTLCMAAVRLDRDALKYVPSYLKTEVMIRTAEQHRPSTKSLTPKSRTCRLALTHSSYFI